MSFYYTFEFTNQLLPQEVANLIETKINVERTDTTQLQAPSVGIDVSEQDELNQEIVYEDYGFRPNLVVTFSLHPSFGLDKGKEVMSLAVAALLKNTLDDAALFYNGETLVLRKKGDEIFLREGWEIFLNSALDANKIKYKIQPEATMTEVALQAA